METTSRRETLGFRLLGWFAAALVRLMSWTYRIEASGDHYYREVEEGSGQGGLLLACWHEHLLGIIVGQAGRPFVAVASRSGAGRLVGFVCERFGYSMVYGSQDRDGKDKGGVHVLRALLRSLKSGRLVAMTVDGSVGPRRRAKRGIVDLARRTGTRIVPVAAVAQSCWTLNTWDRFQIPKPFTRIVVQYGAAISVPSETRGEGVDVVQDEIGQAIDACETSAGRALLRRGQA